MELKKIFSFKVFLVFILSIGLLRYAIFSWQLLNYPFEYAEGEGHAFTRALVWAKGGPLYTSPNADSYPIIVHPYEPLQTVLFGCCFKFVFWVRKQYLRSVEERFKTMTNTEIEKAMSKKIKNNE